MGNKYIVPPEYGTGEYEDQVHDIMVVLDVYASENERKRASSLLFGANHRFSGGAIREALSRIKRSREDQPCN